MFKFIGNVARAFRDEREAASEQPFRRRGELRAAFRFRLGGLRVPVRSGDVVSTMQLKDLSSTGGGGITELAVPVGGKVSVHLPGGHVGAAEVRWTRNTTIGFRYRPRRLPVDAIGTLTTGERVQAVRINNISQRGMQVTQDGSLATGQLVKVTVGHDLERYGIVRWTRPGTAGLWLTQPFTLERLGVDTAFSHGCDRGPFDQSRHRRRVGNLEAGDSSASDTPRQNTAAPGQEGS